MNHQRYRLARIFLSALFTWLCIHAAHGQTFQSCGSTNELVLLPSPKNKSTNWWVTEQKVIATWFEGTSPSTNDLSSLTKPGTGCFKLTELGGSATGNLSGTLTSPYLPYATGPNTLADSPLYRFNSTDAGLGALELVGNPLAPGVFSLEGTGLLRLGGTANVMSWVDLLGLYPDNAIASLGIAAAPWSSLYLTNGVYLGTNTITQAANLPRWNGAAWPAGVNPGPGAIPYSTNGAFVDSFLYQVNYGLLKLSNSAASTLNFEITRGASGITLSTTTGLNGIGGTEPLQLNAGSDSVILDSPGLYPPSSPLPLGRIPTPWGPLTLGLANDGSNYGLLQAYHTGTNGAAVLDSLGVAGGGAPRGFEWRTNGVVIDKLNAVSGYTGAGTKVKLDNGTYGAVPGLSGSYVPLAGGTMTGNLAMNATNRVTGLADPSSAQDAATKAYVDSVAAGLSTKPSVLNATTTTLPANTYANGVLGVGATLTATANGALVVDGVTNSVADRILIKDEAAAANNGIYVVTATGSGILPYILTRATDNNDANDFDGAFVFVESGTVNVSSGWVCTTTGTVVVGTTPINWTQFSGAGEITAGTGLVKSGNTLSVSTTLQHYNGTDTNSILAAVGGAPLASPTFTGTAVAPAMQISSLLVGSMGIGTRSTLTETGGSVICDLSLTNRYWTCSPTGNVTVAIINPTAGNWGNLLLRWPSTNCQFTLAWSSSSSTTNWLSGVPSTNATANTIGFLGIYPQDSTTNSTIAGYSATQ